MRENRGVIPENGEKARFFEGKMGKVKNGDYRDM